MEQVIRREDRVQADVQCLMCGRLIGELFGFVGRQNPGQRTARSLAYLSSFRPTMPGAADVALTGRERFRCLDCGGLGIVQEVSIALARECVPVEALCPVHGERRRRVGRHPKGCGCTGWKAAA